MTRRDDKERLRQERIAAQARAEAEAKKRLWLGYLVAALLGSAVVAGIVFAVTSGGGDGGGGQTTATSPEGEIDLGDHPEVRTDVGVVPDGVQIDIREGTPPPTEVSNGDLAGSADSAGCTLETAIEEEDGQPTHYSDEGKTGEDWNTNPPTSGDHYGSPTEAGSGALADGPFLTPPPIARALHSLEHGRVSVQYSPEMPEPEQLVLKGIFDADSAGVQLFPNPDLDGELAVSAWTNLLTCEDFDAETGSDAVRNFILQFRGQGPEDVPF